MNTKTDSLQSSDKEDTKFIKYISICSRYYDLVMERYSDLGDALIIEQHLHDGGEHLFIAIVHSTEPRIYLNAGIEDIFTKQQLFKLINKCMTQYGIMLPYHLDEVVCFATVNTRDEYPGKEWSMSHRTDVIISLCILATLIALIYHFRGSLLGDDGQERNYELEMNNYVVMSSIEESAYALYTLLDHLNTLEENQSLISRDYQVSLSILNIQEAKYQARALHDKVMRLLVSLEELEQKEWTKGSVLLIINR